MDQESYIYHFGLSLTMIHQVQYINILLDFF